MEFYLADRRTCDLAQSCAMQSLTGEVARADDDARAAYEAELQRVIGAAAAGMTARTDATALLAPLAGRVSLARAVKDPALSEEIAAAVRRAAEVLDTSSRPNRRSA